MNNKVLLIETGFIAALLMLSSNALAGRPGSVDSIKVPWGQGIRVPSIDFVRTLPVSQQRTAYGFSADGSRVVFSDKLDQAVVRDEAEFRKRLEEDSSTGGKAFQDAMKAAQGNAGKQAVILRLWAETKVQQFEKWGVKLDADPGTHSFSEIATQRQKAMDDFNNRFGSQLDDITQRDADGQVSASVLSELTALRSDTNIPDYWRLETAELIATRLQHDMQAGKPPEKLAEDALEMISDVRAMLRNMAQKAAQQFTEAHVAETISRHNPMAIDLAHVTGAGGDGASSTRRGATPNPEALALQRTVMADITTAIKMMENTERGREHVDRIRRMVFGDDPDDARQDPMAIDTARKAMVVMDEMWIKAQELAALRGTDPLKELDELFKKRGVDRREFCAAGCPGGPCKVR